MKTIAALLLVPLLAGVAVADRPPAVVESAEVQELDVGDERSFVGTIVPSRVSLVGNEFAGLVAEFLVEEGDRVEAGQPLAKLRTVVLETRLASARAQLAARKAELAELENGSRPEEKREVKARVGQTSADLSLRRWKLEAAQRLRESRTISIDELREAELSVQEAEEREKEARAAQELV